jgi:tetratricopeptide (TPR) repeat protein
LFDAIGGSGKSMLTWEWINNHATQVRSDWAGRFWYSFYERGAIMADFCRRALAYITREPLDSFKKLKTPALGERLLHQLRDRPWLLVLDGLERVLVAYHRIDAAEVPDDEANQPTDKIAHRDPCAAIRPEDDELLHALAAATPSKLLITSRLVPLVLLNSARQPIPGVLRVALPGLRPADAEALLRSCKVTGDSQSIQNYLKSHCDCHPLVTGVLGGILNDYLPARGNFDAWSADPASGGQLNLADLDLVQKRNHILKAALGAVPKEGRQILAVLALLSEAVDYATLSALNPNLSPDAIRDLERRGLLQYDGQTGRYDLHPVVRGIAAGGLRPDERDSYGQRVVDHFSARTHSPYDEAESLEDVSDGLHVVRTLLKMGRYQQACDAYRGGLGTTLLFNLEANAEVLSLLRPFFPQGWGVLPGAMSEDDGAYLANEASIALSAVGEEKDSLAALGTALSARLKAAYWSAVGVCLRNIGVSLWQQNRLAAAHGVDLSNLHLATLTDDKEEIFIDRLFRFYGLGEIGQWANAQSTWDLLDPTGRNWSRASYRPGTAEYYYAQYRFWQGDLLEEHLAHAEKLAKAGKNRGIVSRLYVLRGKWRMERGEWALAADSLREAVSMARAVGRTDVWAETQLAVARFHLGQLDDPRREAEQLAHARQPAQRALAELWFVIGDREQATKHAIQAYNWAWADGEPYVHRYELNKARALLEKLGAEIPNLPPYDPAKDEKFPCEDEVAAAIEKLRAEKEGEK